MVKNPTNTYTIARCEHRRFIKVILIQAERHLGPNIKWVSAIFDGIRSVSPTRRYMRQFSELYHFNLAASCQRFIREQVVAVVLVLGPPCFQFRFQFRFQRRELIQQSHDFTLHVQRWNRNLNTRKPLISNATNLCSRQVWSFLILKRTRRKEIRNIFRLEIVAIIKHVATNGYFPFTEPSRGFPNSFVILTRRSDQEIAIISVLQPSEFSFRYRGDSLTRRNTKTCMDLPVMNAGHTRSNKISLLKATPANEIP